MTICLDQRVNGIHGFVVSLRDAVKPDKLPEGLAEITLASGKGRRAIKG